MKFQAQMLLLVLSTLCAGVCVCLAQATAEGVQDEQHLIEIIQRWQTGLPKEPVVAAIEQLGQRKSTNAVLVLIQRIAFSSAPTLTTQVMASADSSQRWTESLPCVKALIAIGRPAVGHIVNRLAEIDEESGMRDAYLLRQVLLGVMPREEAVRLLEQGAEASGEDSVKHLRLMTSAKKVSAYPKLPVEIAPRSDQKRKE